MNSLLPTNWHRWWTMPGWQDHRLNIARGSAIDDDEEFRRRRERHRWENQTEGQQQRRAYRELGFMSPEQIEFDTKYVPAFEEDDGATTIAFMATVGMSS